MDNNNQQTAGDTLDEMGKAIKKDAESTKKDVEEAGEWVKEKVD